MSGRRRKALEKWFTADTGRKPSKLAIRAMKRFNLAPGDAVRYVLKSHGVKRIEGTEYGKER